MQEMKALFLQKMTHRRFLTDAGCFGIGQTTGDSMTGQLLNIIFLVIHTMTDVREQKVRKSICGLHFAAGILLCLAKNGSSPVSSAAGMLPGIMLYLLARCTHQAIGYGDCLIIAACGYAAGITDILFVVCIALFAASVFAAAMLICRRAEKQTRFPFVPFLLAAQIADILLCL